MKGERRTYQIYCDEDDTIQYKSQISMIGRTYPPVLNKRNFYERFSNGEFGNHGPMWNTYREYLSSNYGGDIAIRTKRRGGRCDYFIPAREVDSRRKEFLLEYREEELHFSAQCPEQNKTLQGEATLTPQGFYLFGSYSVKHAMRQALALYGFQCYGLEAVCRVKYAMCGASWSWLQTLLERYPDHVIEFTSLSYNWGVIPGFNTVFWEVRKY